MWYVIYPDIEGSLFRQAAMAYSAFLSYDAAQAAVQNLPKSLRKFCVISDRLELN